MILRTHLPALAAFLLAFAWITPAGAAPDRPPNVVIFLTDDQGTLDANCYGSKDLHTPTIDKLAETGVRFTQAYAHYVCCPTRAMLLTGRYPQRSGVSDWTQGDAKTKGKGRNMLLSEITLAEILKGAGYRTGMFGKWHLGAHVDHGPTRQGFDEYFGNRGGFIDNYNHCFLHREGFHDLYEGNKEVFMKDQYYPDLIAGRVLDFLDRHKAEPFFLYLAFNLPHYPEQADSRFEERYKDMPMPRQAYAKVVSTVDDHMGRIMDRLEKLGLRENTIVVFMSDNGHSAEDYQIGVEKHISGLPKGWNYGANGGGGNTGKWRGHKAEFYEGGVRVPAIISWPAKLPKGLVRDQAITAMDWLPTIAELCGVLLPEVELDGRSIMPIIASADAPTHNKVLHWAWQTFWAVREGEWKLISLGKDQRQLVNLNDPEPERKDYLEEKPDIAGRLQALHDTWAEETRVANPD
ncbi:MAG: sulfatase-like hydrolase/transferase [Verrucomicrobia bacterium]|nr:sulfatase-like hydrolase/transferase [Verrucomicrobiota bacterium]